MPVCRVIRENFSEKQLIQIAGIDETFYGSKDIQTYTEYQTSDSYAGFIAPLDNVMWDRQMTERLFDFTYRWEVYTPVPKRKFDYYVLPVLYNGQFVARFEAEPVRQAGEFAVKSWWWEPEITPDDDMLEAIKKEMLRFAEFLQVDNSKDNFVKLGAK